MMEITFIDETNAVSNDKVADIESLLQFAADYLKLPEETEMSVTFMDNAAIQVINRTYRDKDAPTDVISFAMEEEGEDELPIIFDEEDGFELDMPRTLGDIMISTERAQEQAQEYGHSYDRELGFLALHGFLHINGYDHMTPEDEKIMFGLQKEILDAYGLER
jgi:probable rRNA maturation factor